MRNLHLLSLNAKGGDALHRLEVAVAILLATLIPTTVSAQVADEPPVQPLTPEAGLVDCPDGSYSLGFDDPELMDEFLVCVTAMVKPFFEALLPTATFPEIFFVDYDTSMHDLCDNPETPGDEDADDLSAHYCGVDTAVFIGAELIWSEFKDIYGDMSLPVTLAHELGHWYQDMMGRFDLLEAGEDETVEVVRANEIHADCMAGAWTQFAAENNWLEPDDVREGTVAMVSYASSYTDARNHGNARERALAYRSGFFGGAESCAQYWVPPTE